MKGFQARNPNRHVFNAVMHLDEVSPHLHIDFVPFYTKDRQRGLRKGVSLSILERVQNRTYVMSLIEKEKMIRQTEVLGNGFATAGMTIG